MNEEDMRVYGTSWEGRVVRRLRAGFGGSQKVGKGLDGELAQLVPDGPN